MKLEKVFSLVRTVVSLIASVAMGVLFHGNGSSPAPIQNTITDPSIFPSVVLQEGDDIPQSSTVPIRDFISINFDP